MQPTNYPKGNSSQGQLPEGYCQGAIIFGVIAREQKFGDNHPGENYAEAIFFAGNFPRGQLS